VNSKRIWGILIAALLTAGLLGGCASPSPAAPADPGTPAAPAAEPITLRFWNIWGSGDPNTEARDAALAAWQAANPNIVIVNEDFENEAYKTMIKTTVSADEAPDVFSTWGGGFSRPFVDAGKLLDLGPYLQDGTMDKLTGGALNYYDYDGKIFGMTFGKSASGFFVNTEAFTNAGAKIPATWEELLTACEQLKAAGTIPIITSSKERWVISMLFEGMVTKAVGAEVVNKTINKEAGGSYSDPMYLDALNRLGELVSKGYINSDMAALSRDEVLASFKNGDAGLYYMGAWESSALEADDSLIKGKVDWIPFPTIPGGKGSGTEFNGGAIDGLVISANTAHPDEAAAFLKFFCEAYAREGYQRGNYMPVWNTAVIDESQLPLVFAKISKATSTATNFVIWWDTFLTGDDVTLYQDALDKFVNNAMSAEDAINEFKKIQP
jgi:raffinose/stachyose/melibiose transport system substrate-binding protein